ncbi:MAG TPA: hypothetical protein VG965_07330 [Patescibacteria group bacterium]|nr:hypothetical protein [Patescibacteria group bacterium]
MRKFLSPALASAALLATAIPALADDSVLNASVGQANGTIPANTSLGSIITFIVAFIIIFAILAALMFIVIGALQWITSGGDKQRVSDARNHIIAAVIGLIVIALSFVIINVVITALGLGSLTNLHIQTLNQIKGGQ